MVGGWKKVVENWCRGCEWPDSTEFASGREGRGGEAKKGRPVVRGDELGVSGGEG